MAFNTKAEIDYKAQPCGRNLVTLKAILIALGLIVAAISFAIAIFKVAKKADDDMEEYMALYAEQQQAINTTPENDNEP